VSAEPEIAGAEGVGTVRIVEPAPAADAAAPPEPIVDWPPEETRRILALRLVAPQAERFSGRALRLALAAEGFLLGRFAIFHKPDESNRAVLSAAALTRPGAFDLETMDSQRYAGLSLFAVLPGPKTPQQAFEELLATARNLNERLEGALQDERGGPLTPLRVASIRDNLRAEAATLKTAAAQ
jgi:cell division protein ZipA